MKWTTWEKIGVDRQACAWFIKKYVDKEATFSFIPRDMAPSDIEHAFDTPTSKWTHKQGHSSFYMLVREYAPKDLILKKMAEIVDGADTVNDVLPPPEAYGLEAICIGVRVSSSGDDEAIKKGTIVYDALYDYLKAR